VEVAILVAPSRFGMHFGESVYVPTRVWQYGFYVERVLLAGGKGVKMHITAISVAECIAEGIDEQIGNSVG
jgi:hypothetical protein